MATPYVHGAVGLFVLLPGTGTPVFLGTGERAPRISRRRRISELRNDLAGEEAFDFSYQGSSAFVVVKLTRWNEAVLLALENVPAPFLNTDLGGIEKVGAIGSLLITQNLASQLWCVYDYGTAGRAPNIVYNANGMRPGFHAFAAWLEGPDDIDGGTDPATEAIVFRCGRVYDPLTGNFNMFDRNMAPVAVVPWN